MHVAIQYQRGQEHSRSAGKTAVIRLTAATIFCATYPLLKARVIPLHHCLTVFVGRSRDKYNILAHTITGENSHWPAGNPGSPSSFRSAALPNTSAFIFLPSGRSILNRHKYTDSPLLATALRSSQNRRLKTEYSHS